MLSCQWLGFGFSSRIRITTVRLLAEPPTGKTVKFGKEKRANFHQRCDCVQVSGGYLSQEDVHALYAKVVPNFHSPPKKTPTLLVSLWVRGIFSATCHATDPNYSPSTYLPSLSGSFVLPAPFPETQLNSTNPVRRKAFSNPLCPSSPSVVSLLLPRILLSSCTVSSFCFNERKRSAGQTPGVWQSYLLCLHIYSSPSFLSFSPSP